MQSHSHAIENAQIFYGCLHFRYNGKKYLYGLSEELLTFGGQSGLLSRFNGSFQPTEKQKKQKSSLLLKKQKTALKIDYIIIPRKPCQSQFLWHFSGLFQQLNCRHFLILSLNKEAKDFSADVDLKKKILAMIISQNNALSSLSFSSLGYKIESFADHPNIRKNKEKLVNSNTQQVSDKEFNQPEIIEIYEDTLHDLIIKLNKKQECQFASNSIFQYIQPKNYLQTITELINTIRHNSCLSDTLRLTPEQIYECRQQLSNEILCISTSSQVFYPTNSQQMKLIFLPSTSMIVAIHKHQILLINPCNLASWKLFDLGFPVNKVRYVLQTRFSMAFVEFLITWSVIGQSQAQNMHTFIEIVTLQKIYQQVMVKLKQVFLWTDQMIKSKIAFRVVPTFEKASSSSALPIVRFKNQSLSYNLGFIKCRFIQTEVQQDLWHLTFGNKVFCFMNELLVLDQKQYTKFDYIIFDKIDESVKKSFYKLSQSDSHLKEKYINNRCSTSKYNHKYFYLLQQSKPIITIESQLKIPQAFLFYFSSQLDSRRYERVKLYPGETINCLGRNILLTEGLALATFEQPKGQKEVDHLQKGFRQQGQKQQDHVSQDHIQQDHVSQDHIQQDHVSQDHIQQQTIVYLWYPADLIKNGSFINIKSNKIREFKELICLKQAIVLIEEVQSEWFFQNYLGKSQISPNSEHLLKSSLQLSALASNSFIKLLSTSLHNMQHCYVCIQQNSSKLKQSAVFESLNQFVEKNSPFHELNHLAKKVTLESGQAINFNCSKIYFILKGSMKWNNNSKSPNASNSAFIGNIEDFYLRKVQKQIKKLGGQILNLRQDKNFAIQVIKDTWALEMDMQNLDQYIFIKYPELVSNILQKGMIFY